MKMKPLRVLKEGDIINKPVKTADGYYFDLDDSSLPMILPEGFVLCEIKGQFIVKRLLVEG